MLYGHYSKFNASQISLFKVKEDIMRGIHLTVMMSSNPAKRMAKAFYIFMSIAISIGLCESGTEQYLLITNETLKGSFQPLVDRRMIQGMDGKLITIEEIETNPEYIGADVQEKIRDCIKRHYDPTSTMYLLLGGDEKIVPVRYCRTTSDGENLPVDLYYADMDGIDWDADGDGIYGEIGDIGLTELTPEVCLGRIPVNKPEEVEAYYSKILRYESIDPAEFVDSMLLLSGAGYEYCYEGPERPPMYRDHEPVSQKEIEMTDVFWNIIQPYWQPGQLVRYFDSNTDWDASQFGDFPITWQNVRNTLNRGYHYIYYWQHSGSRYWTFRDEDTGCIFNWFHGSTLTNAFPTIMFARGCSTAAYDLDESDVDLCESLIRNGNGGAIVYFGHTRSTGGSPHWDQILRNMFQESHPRIGDAYKACLTVLAPEKIDNPWHQYVFVMLGDPAIVPHHQQKKTMQVLSPKGNETIQVGSDLIIRWNAAGNFSPEDQVALSYSDDDGLNWYPIPSADPLPFNAASFTWASCPLPCGSGYRVRISSVADPGLRAESNKSFEIAEMVELTIKSEPIHRIKITGSHCYQTKFTLSVIRNQAVRLTAPEKLNDFVFVGWITEDGITVTQDCHLNRSFDTRTTLTATYEYRGDFLDFYVNDDIPDNGVAAGDNNQDGCSPTTPMRSIQTLLDRYPNIGYGDVIHVSEGRYFENLILSPTHVGLTLRGVGPGQTVIDGNHTESCLWAEDGWWGQLEHLGFENGMGTKQGGALLLSSGSACVVRDCWFINNETVGKGGAIYVNQSDWSTGLVLENCRFENNSASIVGGAIHIRGQTVGQAKDCLFIANSAPQGGAVEAESLAEFVAEDCLFQGNAAPEGGGAIHNMDSSSSKIKRSIFKENTGYQGGGIYTGEQSMVEVDHCLITGNQVTQAGGAVGIYHDAVFTATNCTVAGNSSSNVSGGIAWHSWGTLTLTNCIMFGNPSRLHPDLRLSGKGAAVVSYCCTPILRDGVGNITDDPLFVDADTGDFHLKSQVGRWDGNNGRWVVDDMTSPCIDAGDPDSDWKGEFWPHGGRINMGVYGGTSQASMSLSTVGNLADLDLNNSVDISDLMLLVDHWTQEDKLLQADLDQNGQINLKDFSILAFYWLKDQDR